MKNNEAATWRHNLEFYDRLVEGNPKFERKGKTMPYTSANGYMFSQLNKAGEIGIRLPKAVGKTFMEEYQSAPFRSYGAVMKDYVLIPAALHNKPEVLADLLDQSYEYVMSLPPNRSGQK